MSDHPHPIPSLLWIHHHSNLITLQNKMGFPPAVQEVTVGVHIHCFSHPACSVWNTVTMNIMGSWDPLDCGLLLEQVCFMPKYETLFLTRTCLRILILTYFMANVEMWVILRLSESVLFTTSAQQKCMPHHLPPGLLLHLFLWPPISCLSNPTSTLLPSKSTSPLIPPQPLTFASIQFFNIVQKTHQCV